MDFAAVYTTLNARKHPIYEAALEDCGGNEIETAKYLNDIKQTAATFICDHRNVWDGEELIGSLREIQRTDGNFVCLLGGKNTGKSLLMNHIAKKTDSTIVIDLRSNPDIVDNLTKVLEEKGLIKYVNGAIEFANVYLTDDSDIKIPALQLSLERIIDGLILMHGNITIVIDEANRTFTINPSLSEKDVVDKALVALELFTRLAKQEKRVLLNCDDHFR